MNKVIDTEKFPIKLWLEDIEDGALEQAKSLANLPFVYKWIALMPDTHQGYGMPIGGVLATKDVIIPNAVGVDIGCGMAAMRTSLQPYTVDKDLLKLLMGKIREAIPVGFNHHKEKQQWDGLDVAPNIPVINKEKGNAQYQIGTLGGGNHFIEIQKGSDGYIWVMLHSGSRNFGLKIAREYHERAQTLCAKWYSNLPNKDLAFLPMHSEEGKEYNLAMEYALYFAKDNRKIMMENIRKVLQETVQGITFDDVDVIDVHHNYARWENHYGENVMVHRKGATSARLHERGIIPGSQGSKSYLVLGLGNPESFMSCSHGAGRKLGRKQASLQLNLEKEQKILDDQGIVHGLRNVKDLDEATGAYKDIATVMDNQKDLVKIEVELTPLAVIKA